MTTEGCHLFIIIFNDQLELAIWFFPFWNFNMGNISSWSSNFRLLFNMYCFVVYGVITLSKLVQIVCFLQVMSWFASLFPNASGKERSGTCMSQLSIFYQMKKWMPLKQEKIETLVEPKYQNVYNCYFGNGKIVLYQCLSLLQ